MKSFLRKITRRELTDDIKEALKCLQKDKSLANLPKGYSYFNDEITRTIRGDEKRVTYTYDDNGLLKRKSVSSDMNQYNVLYEPHGSFTGKKEGRKLSTLQRAAVTGGIATLIAASLYIRTLIPPTIEHRESQRFNAEENKYKIEINVSCYGNKWENITHLTQEGSDSLPIAITGHDYDFDGNWDAIFIRRKPIDGYSSVKFVDGKVIWEPCPADERKGLERFSPQEIASTRLLLNNAQKYIADENRTENWSADVELN